jgi:hypothetical protein
MTAREVLQELVACADLLREVNDSRARDLDVKSPRSIDLERDYDMRAPLAWNAARAYLAQPEPQDDVERELAWARAYRSKNEQYVAYDALVAINEKLSHELAESYERAAQVCEERSAKTQVFYSQSKKTALVAEYWFGASDEARHNAERIRALKGKPLNQEE